MYIWTSAWVLHTPNADLNLLFPCFHTFLLDFDAKISIFCLIIKHWSTQKRWSGTLGNIKIFVLIYLGRYVDTVYLPSVSKLYGTLLVIYTYNTTTSRENLQKGLVNYSNYVKWRCISNNFIKGKYF